MSFYGCDASIWEAEAGGSPRVGGQPGLHSGEFRVNCTGRFCLKKQKLVFDSRLKGIFKTTVSHSGFYVRPAVFPSTLGNPVFA